MATTTSPTRPITSRSTTIALKLLMAVTGLIFALFVLAHMYGNLKIYAGEEAFNTYSEHLRTLGEPMLPRLGFLWIMRVVLLVSLVGHVYAAAALWKRSNHARTQKYAVRKRVAQSISSKWIRWGGVTILLFLIWHLLEFTILKVSVNPDKTGAAVTENPYVLFVSSFQVWWLTLIYLIAMIALGMHLNHGVWSAQQTLGWTNTTATRRRAKAIAAVVALVVSVGFILAPIGILFGIIK